MAPEGARRAAFRSAFVEESLPQRSERGTGEAKGVRRMRFFDEEQEAARLRQALPLNTSYERP